MDSPTPDAPANDNAPDAAPKDLSPDGPGAEAPQDDAPIDVKPSREGTREPAPAAKGESKEAAASAPQPAPADGDEVLYRGSVSLWLGWRSFAAAIGAALLGLVLFIVGLVKSNVGAVHFLGTYVGLPLLLAALLMCGYVFLSLRCLRYKITNRLIERERGIVVKRVDSLDLSRVKDVQLVQNLMERILRIGTIEILSSDRTDPLMRIEAIPKPRPIYEKLRDTVIKISQKRGIIAMDR